MADPHDAIVVGSGPNGLAAAITLAREGLSVLVLEAESTVGGGTRSAELTLPGYTHDICSAIHPMALASPFMRSLPLAEHGLELIQPPAPLAHPLDDGTAVLLERSIDDTCRTLGPDADSYRRLMSPLVDASDILFNELLGPLRLPRHPWTAARFGLNALRSARGLAGSRFRGEPAKALLAGLAGHAIVPLEKAATSAIALILGIAGHAVGWPLAEGGSQNIADAMTSYLRALGGEIVTNQRVTSLDELPKSRVVLLDLTPRQLVRIAGDRLSPWYRRRLSRYRYGPGVFKLDWALDGPIPWVSPDCARAATVHLGGTLGEIAASEAAVGRGEHPERPYVLLAQQSLFDPSRAPAGKQTAWAYCHVPNGSSVDMTDRIEDQVERLPPISATASSPATRWDRPHSSATTRITSGAISTAGPRTSASSSPARSPASSPTAHRCAGLYICSSSTPPGGGVHGLCGHFAARAALRHDFGRRARVSEGDSPFSSFVKPR